MSVWAWPICLEKAVSFGCCLLQFLDIFNFKSLSVVQVQSAFGAFFRFDMQIQKSTAWSLLTKRLLNST